MIRHNVWIIIEKHKVPQNKQIIGNKWVLKSKKMGTSYLG